jgi:transcriptional regulator with XRE-family HTH domain
MTRRRTAGLRREEVAQRANVSATWYTWLEQGRGGAPSADVLNRLARALMLTDVEREHLFFIALGRPPEVRYHAAEGVTPRLQRVLDALELSPAIVKTSTWDIVAWNCAAAAVLADYEKFAPRQRNVLRLIFCNPEVRAAQPDWEAAARFVVAAFRVEAARAGAAERVKDMVDQLSRESAEFAVMWRNNDVRTYGEGSKHLRHPKVGLTGLEDSALRGRRPARSGHGDLQSGDAGGCRADPIPPQTANVHDQYASCKTPDVSASALALLVCCGSDRDESHAFRGDVSFPRKAAVSPGISALRSLGLLELQYEVIDRPRRLLR